MAQQLAGLEQQRKALSARLDEAKESRLAAPGGAPGARGSAELRKLQERVRRAADALQGLSVGRAEQLGRLERAERLLASCERSLETLSLTQSTGSHGEPATACRAPASGPLPQIVPLSDPPASRVMSAEETAARDRVQQLGRAKDAVSIEQARAKQALVEARAQVDRLRAQAESLVQADNFMPRLDSSATTGLNSYLRSLSSKFSHGRPSQSPARAAAFNGILKAHRRRTQSCLVGPLAPPRTRWRREVSESPAAGGRVPPRERWAWWRRFAAAWR
jgi:chromosome segregation ATPase